MAWRLLAWAAGTACRFGDAADAIGARHRARAPRGRRPSGAPRGHRVRRRRVARADQCRRRRSPDASRASSRLRAIASPRGSSSQCSAGLYAMQGAFDHARDLVTRAQSLLEELDLDVEAARVDLEAWRVEMLAGDLDAAERDYAEPTRHSTRSARSTSSRPSPDTSRRRSSSATADRGRRGARRPHPGACGGRRRRDPGVVAVCPRPNHSPGGAPSATPRPSPAKPLRSSSRPMRR